MKILKIILLVLLSAAFVILALVLAVKPFKSAIIATSAPFSSATPEKSTEVLSTVTMEPTATIEPTQKPLPPVVPPADEASERLSVPAGFAIRIFADNLPGTPRFMALDPEGQLYVSLYRGNEIARLPDLDHDGLADKIEIVASGLNGPHGLEWHEGWLYVAEIGKVSRMQDSDGDGLLEIYQIVTENIPGPDGHSTRTVHFGPDGKMYVSAGSSCNVCAEDDPRRAAILRFNPDGSITANNPFANDPDPRKQPVWAWGLRNSVDFLWTPSGAVWASHNGRDRLIDTQGTADTLPPEEIIISVQANRSHGWPYCYTASQGVNQPAEAEVLDPQSKLLLPAGFDCSLANVTPALFTDLAHSAPLGMTLGDAQLAFPVEYQNSLYVAYHGSWNTTPASFRDCKVQRIRLQGELPLASEEFVNGFRAAGQKCNGDGTWGRPADVIVGADGALYISDDKGGRVYRVVYVGE